MNKIFIFLFLFLIFIIYSFVVYTNGTETKITISHVEQPWVSKGKLLFQKHNCISCHQLYGLGGYLGPDLTTAWSDKYRGKEFIKAFLKSGGPRMPDFKLSEEEIDCLLLYLKQVDSSAITYKAAEK